ncbi:MAG: PhzF family phenazine biosynthesis protein [Candidatus Acidiferrales bacterium]
MKEFWQIDTFTTQPFCGNPAAVVFETDGMNAEWMQAVSREMNLSETVFFARPTKPGNDYRIRFFTPRRELPFAGHPTIAAAHAFVERYCDGAGAKGVIRQECEAGIIPIHVRKEGDTRVYVMQQRSPEYRDLRKPADDYARLLGCASDELETGPVQVVSTGVPWVIIQLSNEQALEGLAPNFLEIEQECRRERAVGITVFALSRSESPWIVNVRTFAPGEGVLEDPVCGSGNGAVGAYLAKNVFPGQVEFQYQAFQGQQVNRPGQVSVHCARGGDGDLSVCVGGAAIRVLEGKVLL